MKAGPHTRSMGEAAHSRGTRLPLPQKRGSISVPRLRMKSMSWSPGFSMLCMGHTRSSVAEHTWHHHTKGWSRRTRCSMEGEAQKRAQGSRLTRHRTSPSSMGAPVGMTTARSCALMPGDQSLCRLPMTAFCRLKGPVTALGGAGRRARGEHRK